MGALRSGPGARPRAKKRFGQHFLSDANILRRIVDAAELEPADELVPSSEAAGA